MSSSEIGFDSDPHTNKFTRCLNCENIANKRCSRCYVAKYCSLECQKSDWKKHKKICNHAVEKHQADQAHGISFGNHECLHGAPDIQGEFGYLGSNAVQLMVEIMSTHLFTPPRERENAEIECVMEFCHRQPINARDLKLVQVLVSMASDAFLDDRLPESRQFTRIALYIENFALTGALDGPMPSTLCLLVDECATKTGLYQILSSRTSCDCLKTHFDKECEVAKPYVQEPEDEPPVIVVLAAAAFLSSPTSQVSPDAPILTEKHIRALTLRDLKKTILLFRGSIEGCVEKTDLQQRLIDLIKQGRR